MSKHYKRLARLLGWGAQYGALPWRVEDGTLQVMLITSRETQRWTIPKGWPVKKLAPAEAAAREALEEAGVAGKVGERIGAYRYDKRLRDGEVVICAVEVFPLRVAEERARWPEERERGRGWFGLATAATLVHEPELKAMILAFAPPEG